MGSCFYKNCARVFEFQNWRVTMEKNLVLQIRKEEQMLGINVQCFSHTVDHSPYYILSLML